MAVDAATLGKRFAEAGYVIVRGAYAGQGRELRRICEGGARPLRHDRDRGQPAERRATTRPGRRMLIHLNHPDYHRERPADLATLLDAVAGEDAIAIATAILAEPPLFLQCNLYVEPPRESWVGGWHRDCQYDKFDLRPDEDTERIILSEAVPAREVHMHICLCDSAATEIVPGSHRRWDTPEEYEVRVNDYWSDDMPGREPIRLAGRRPGVLPRQLHPPRPVQPAEAAPHHRRHLGDRVAAASGHARGHERARRLRRKLPAVVRRSDLPRGHHPRPRARPSSGSRQHTGTPGTSRSRPT